MEEKLKADNSEEVREKFWTGKKGVFENKGAHSQLSGYLAMYGDTPNIFYQQRVPPYAKGQRPPVGSYPDYVVQVRSKAITDDLNQKVEKARKRQDLTNTALRVNYLLNHTGTSTPAPLETNQDNYNYFAEVGKLTENRRFQMLFLGGLVIYFFFIR